MPVEYPFFSFAAPPETGHAWFVEACRSAGLGRGSVEDALVPFSSERGGDELRVSLVRHPCSWLASTYRALQRMNEEHPRAVHFLGTSFVGLDKSSFDAFVRSYLNTFPTGISCLFDRYESDVRFRFEDMPWALSELLETFDVPRVMRERAERLERPDCSERLPPWKTHLHRQVMEAEEEFCHALDYY